QDGQIASVDDVEVIFLGLFQDLHPESRIEGLKLFDNPRRVVIGTASVGVNGSFGSDLLELGGTELSLACISINLDTNPPTVSPASDNCNFTFQLTADTATVSPDPSAGQSAANLEVRNFAVLFSVDSSGDFSTAISGDLVIPFGKRQPANGSATDATVGFT